MDIKEFFQLSAGKWFSQRTSHHLPLEQAENGKSEIRIEILSPDDAATINLCQQYGIDAGLVWGGARVTWDGTMEWDKVKKAGSSILIPIADPEKPNQGKLLRDVGYAGKAGIAGRYILGNDDALTLISSDETMYSEERIWFASPNLRLRTCILKRADGFSNASFCSEIRMAIPQPQATAADAANA